MAQGEGRGQTLVPLGVSRPVLILVSLCPASPDSRLCLQAVFISAAIIPAWRLFSWSESEAPPRHLRAEGATLLDFSSMLPLQHFEIRRGCIRQTNSSGECCCVPSPARWWFLRQPGNRVRPTF